MRNSDISSARAAVSACLPWYPGKDPVPPLKMDVCSETAPMVTGSALVGVDGFAIASGLPGSVEERRVSAMSPAMLALGEQTANEFEHGELERVLVEGGDGHTIVTSASPRAVLAAIASKDAKLGLIFLQMGRIAEVAKEAMAGQQGMNKGLSLGIATFVAFSARQMGAACEQAA